MKHEILYQYDLPIEILDAVPHSEEVTDVIYARSKSKILIPILITKERILWAEPETVSTYQLHELQYVDVASVKVRFTKAIPTTLSLTTVNKITHNFSGIRNNPRSIRKALFSICSEKNERENNEWSINENKTIIYDEFILNRNNSDGLESLPQTTILPKQASDQDIFENLPGDGCYESNEKMFSHFPSNGDDIFEDTKDSTNTVKELQDEGAKSKVARLVETVKEEIQRINTIPADLKKNEPVKDDSVVFNNNSGEKNEQWSSEITGDAMILDKKFKGKNKFSQKSLQREYSSDEDDSVVLENNTKTENSKDRTKYKYQNIHTEFSPEDDDSEVYTTDSDIPRDHRKKYNYDHETTLKGDKRIISVADTIDSDQVDKRLELLKLERDSKKITEEEYKTKSLRLFKEGK